jgi:hypothetical protein
VIHGGPDRNFEWYYLNPFIFYHGEQLNEGKNGNTLGALDFVARPGRRLELYGQLLIDDVQIEKTRSGDLEPNEIAYLFGAQVADPLGTRGTTIGLEYTRIANRTYNTILEWEKFLHRNRPLAHFLGNDFDRWLLQTSTYLGSRLQLYATAELLRRGEGRIESQFDMPWLEQSLEEGYSESFPSGVVEKSRHLRLEARWQPRLEIFLSLEGQFSSYKNFAHAVLAGETKNVTSFFLRFWWEKDWWLPLGN